MNIYSYLVVLFIFPFVGFVNTGQSGTSPAREKENQNYASTYNYTTSEIRVQVYLGILYTGKS